MSGFGIVSGRIVAAKARSPIVILRRVTAGLSHRLISSECDNVLPADREGSVWLARDLLGAELTGDPNAHSCSHRSRYHHNNRLNTSEIHQIQANGSH
jgi:hypothetical protein